MADLPVRAGRRIPTFGSSGLHPPLIPRRAETYSGVRPSQEQILRAVMQQQEIERQAYLFRNLDFVEEPYDDTKTFSQQRREQDAKVGGVIDDIHPPQSRDPVGKEYFMMPAPNYPNDQNMLPDEMKMLKEFYTGIEDI